MTLELSYLVLATTRSLLHLAIVPPMGNLPLAQPDFERHPKKSSNANASGVAHASRPQAEFPVFLGNVVCDLCKGTYVYKTTQKPFPEDDDAHYVKVWYEIEHGVKSKDNQIGNLQEGWNIEMMDSDERRGRAGDENANLVDSTIGRVK